VLNRLLWNAMQVAMILLVSPLIAGELNRLKEVVPVQARREHSSALPRSVKLSRGSGLLGARFLGVSHVR
jgi:hypothetical protein